MSTSKGTSSDVATADRIQSEDKDQKAGSGWHGRFLFPDFGVDFRMRIANCGVRTMKSSYLDTILSTLCLSFSLIT